VQDWHYHPRIFWVGFKDLLDADLSVATELYNAAVEAMKPQRPLLLYTGVEENDPIHSVLLQLGFREFRRVYSPTLDVQAFDLPSLTKTTQAFEKLGCRAVTLAGLDPLTPPKGSSTRFSTKSTRTPRPSYPRRPNALVWRRGGRT